MPTIKIFGVLENTEDSCYDEFHTTEDGAKQAISKRKPQKWLSGSDRYTWDELELVVDDANLIPRQSVADALAALRAEYDDHEFSAVWRPWLLERLDATIAALGLAPKEDNGTN